MPSAITCKPMPRPSCSRPWTSAAVDGSVTTSATNGPAPPATPADAATLLRSRQYLRLLVLAAVLGVPIAAAAYWYLVLTGALGHWLYGRLPRLLELDPVPVWWPLPLLGVAGLLVGLLVEFVPGRGGESPLDGFRPGGGPAAPVPLLGIAVAGGAPLPNGVYGVTVSLKGIGTLGHTTVTLSCT